MSRVVLVFCLAAATVLAATAGATHLPSGGQLSRIARVVDGDTVALANGAHVRLVQIDTPEVYYSPECYGKQASAVTKHLLPAGTLVRLYREPKTDAVDSPPSSPAPFFPQLPPPLLPLPPPYHTLALPTP